MDVTNDPCDELPEDVTRSLYGQLMLERTDGPVQRAAIKHAMRSKYGKLGRPIALDNDPCDPMPWAIRWEPMLDSRTRMSHAEFGKLLINEFRGEDMPPSFPARRLPLLP